MRKLIIISTIILWIFSCQSRGPESAASSETVETSDTEIEVAASRFDQYLHLLKGKKVALVVNQTSMVGEVHLVDTLRSLGINLVKVFAPEHGFRGDHADGAHISSGKDPKTGLEVLSLYGSTKKPSPEMLQGVDLVIFDIQDVGVRFYTFISTMHYVMEACAEQAKEMIVLDRPNPNGFYIDGPVLDLKYQSFIGMHPIPIVHGLTVAELAHMIIGEAWINRSSELQLTTIECKNYSHSSYYELPVRPSPNLPNMNSVYLYPYLGLFEGTNVSVGRGTDKPFQMLGRPGYKGEITFTPKSMPGISDHPKYEGKTCGGFLVTDVVTKEFFIEPGLRLNYLLEFYKTNRKEDGDFFRDFFYKLSGNETLMKQIESGATEEEIKLSWAKDLEEYKEMRKKYLLYP
ncbi:DUF1343 domain-containing protein [bacterium]|nr:DUF1343 domain-containing protein [bacterium]